MLDHLEERRRYQMDVVSIGALYRQSPLLPGFGGVLIHQSTIQAICLIWYQTDNKYVNDKIVFRGIDCALQDQHNKLKLMPFIHVMFHQPAFRHQLTHTTSIQKHQ